MKRAVLIGLGMVADTHVNAIADTGGQVALHGVMSTSRAKALTFAEEAERRHGFGQPKIYDDVDRIAADPMVDFVILCTPPNARAHLVDVLVDAGKPILMEKPVERTLDAATAIVTRCEAAGVPLGIVFQHRMREASIELRKLVNSGALGKLALVEIAVPWWRPQSYYDAPGRGSYARDGGGVLISQAIHTLDLALALTGEVKQVTAMARTTKLHEMDSEDFVTAGLEFESGAVGSLVASTASYPGEAESIVLHGTEGSATLKSGQLHLSWNDGRTEVLGKSGGTGGGADPMAFTHAWHQGIIEDFAARLDDNQAPVVSGREALRVHRLIEALIRSSNEKRTVILSGSERT